MKCPQGNEADKPLVGTGANLRMGHMARAAVTKLDLRCDPEFWAPPSVTLGKGPSF